MDEGLVAVEQPVAAGQQVTLEPALAEVLGQDLHHPPLGRQVLVHRLGLGLPHAVGGLEHGVEPVRQGLVRAHQPEAVGVAGDHVAQEDAQHTGGFAGLRSGILDRDRVIAEVGHLQRLQQPPAVRVRVGTHAPLPVGGERGQLLAQPAVLVEQLLGPVGTHPALELGQVGRLRREFGQRDLVCPEGPLHGQSVHHLRAGPSLGCAQHDHRPAGPAGRPAGACRALDLGDLGDRPVECGGHLLMDGLRLGARHEQRLVAVALEQCRQLAFGDACEDRRVGDLPAVEVQDRQHRPVLGRVEELVRVPAGRQRARLGLAVADDHAHQQVGVVERGPVGVDERVAELTPLVDRPGRLRRCVTGDATREGELTEQPPQPLLVATDVGIDLAVGALEVDVGDHRRGTVAGAGDEHRVQVPLSDDAVHMDVGQVQPGIRAPVPEQPRLGVLEPQRLVQEGVVEQVDLSHRQVVRRPPVGVDEPQLVLAERPARRSGDAPRRGVSGLLAGGSGWRGVGLRERSATALGAPGSW